MIPNKGLWTVRPRRERGRQRLVEQRRRTFGKANLRLLLIMRISGKRLNISGSRRNGQRRRLRLSWWVPPSSRSSTYQPHPEALYQGGGWQGTKLTLETERRCDIYPIWTIIGLCPRDGVTGLSHKVGAGMTGAESWACRHLRCGKYAFHQYQDSIYM